MKSIIISFFTLVLLSNCGNKSAQVTPEETPNSKLVEITEAQLKNANIVTGKAQLKNISSILKVNGIIDVPPQNMVSISVPLGGYLKTTRLLPGMRVAKGEIIAVMEDQQYIQLQQDYLTAKAKFSYTESEFNRQKELNQSKASSDKTFELAESEYKSQRVLIKSLYEKLKLIGVNPDNLTDNNLSRSINIPSPIDGFVSKVNVNIGKYVNPADVLFELVNPTDIHLSLTIFEKDLSKLFIGQKLTAYTNNEPDRKFDCEIILIGMDLSSERSVNVHCHFSKYDKSLIPGMYMNADIAVKTTDALVVPDAAVVTLGGKQYVFEAKSNTQFEMTEVHTGISEGGFTQISAKDINLEEKNLVINNAYTVFMKMQNKAE
ncbi:MAG TPA: efflux RND transporter periplasmic adaptor subunit [Chitinophagales bacterium]|nr:efflux RND transporter periplasmic adaptor subunit [Chitinophagales bacterium]